jgi:hypothetical protein
MRAMVATELGRSVIRGVGAALLVLGGGCSSSRQPQPPTPVNCALEAQYGTTVQSGVLEHYDNLATPGWYNYGDTTPGAVQTGQDGGPGWIAPIEDGGLCGSQTALLLQAHGYQDYGCGFGTYNFGMAQLPCTNSNDGGSVTSIDAGGFQGMRFWARSVDLRPSANPEDTTKTVTLNINDKTSYGGGCNSVCTVYNYPDAGAEGGAGFSAGYVPTPSVNSGSSTLPTGSGMGGLVLPADACGNAFTYPLVTSDTWQFYTIPFSAFTQAPRPNRVPTGFDPTSFYQFLITVPKEARLELWIANLGFYGTKQDAGP